VLPITSNTAHVYSFEVLLPKGIADLPKESKAKSDQIRTLDKSRLIKSIGILPDTYVDLIDEAIKFHLALK
jgi:mRNA interferase MazF